MKRFAYIVATGAVMLMVGAAGSASAQSPIDLKGTWVGTGQNIVDGPANHHPPTGAGVKPAAKYRLSDQTFTMTIEGQDGRRFWGTMASSNKTERLIGSLSVDGKFVYMVDDDGYIDGTVVNATTLDICYRHVRPDSAVVGCELMQRK
jgi:hypothetical protein